MSQPHRVLYIEADNLIQSWVAPMLRRRGYLVKEARTVETARHYIEANEPLTLVLLGDLTRSTDLINGIPLDELSLVKSIRERSVYDHTPVIVWTNVDWLPDAYRAGINAHLLKPSGAHDLNRTITPYLAVVAGGDDNDLGASCP